MRLLLGVLRGQRREVLRGLLRDVLRVLWHGLLRERQLRAVWPVVVV